MKRSNRRKRDTAPESALLAAWSATLRRHGERMAVTEAASGDACTFRELDERAEAWRARHAADGDAWRGRAVVFAAANGIGWFEIFLGLAKAGAVIVPLDPGEPVAERRRIAEELRAAAWWDGGQPVSLPRARRHRNPETCLIKLTSGTTGRPRPLAFTAAQMLADARQVTATMGIRARDLNYGLIPPGHSYGLGNLTLPLIAHGVPLVCGSAPLPQAIAADLARWKPTIFPGVPAMWRALAAADIAAEAWRGLRLAISAGAPLPPEVAADFAARSGRRIRSFYGSSETGGIAFDPTGAATLAGGVGRPLRGVRVTRLRGGRIRVCSAAVFTCGNRRKSAGLGCWVPPDAAGLDARGGITLLGRRGSTVKIGGRRVNLAEIARRLRGIEGVRDVWIGVSDAREPVLGAAIAGGRTIVELRAALHTDTAAWKVPKKWAVLPEFPLTARGKTDARALRARVFGAGSL